ncbi:MAG: SsrA-binding protein SmpB [Saprospirales bacterium]|nr:MAG: SsrA-binding protein SmpB [Saprospirales bacterium]
MKEEKLLVEIINRKAHFQYFLDEFYEAGMQLMGSEIKSIRRGAANLNDAYCYFHNGELYVKSMYIAEYKFAAMQNHETRRPRKLLLKKSELKKLERKVREKGYSIIPYRIIIGEGRGLAKLEIALARGKKSFDKRDSIKAKDQKRDMERRGRE